MKEKKVVEGGYDEEFDSYAVKILRRYKKQPVFVPTFTITSGGFEFKIRWLGYEQKHPKYTILFDDSEGTYLLRENELGERVLSLVEQVNKVYEELKQRGILPNDPETIGITR